MGCVSRREFLVGSTAFLAGSSLLAGCSSMRRNRATVESIRQCGPAAKYRPTLWAAFVRREGDYGMLWPGAVYDGEAARGMYGAKMAETAAQLGAELNLRAKPLYSLAEGQAWIAQAEAAKADGLVLVMLDRQQHAWPTAQKVAQSKIPSIVYSPLGSSFTTNTDRSGRDARLRRLFDRRFQPGGLRHEDALCGGQDAADLLRRDPGRQAIRLDARGYGHHAAAHPRVVVHRGIPQDAGQRGHRDDGR